MPQLFVGIFLPFFALIAILNYPGTYLIKYHTPKNRRDEREACGAAKRIKYRKHQRNDYGPACRRETKIERMF